MEPDSNSSNEKSSPTTIIRRATVEDFDSVMDILPDVYDGMDYLPYFYYTFFQRNRHVSYLIEENGLAISFVIVELSQENSVATMMAVRTRRSHQGQGLSVSRNKALRSLILADHPTIKSEALTMKMHDGNDKIRSQMKLVFQVKMDSFTIRVDETRERLGRCKMDGKHHTLSYLDSLKLLYETNVFEDFLSHYTTEYITAAVNGRLVKVNKTDMQLVFATNRICVTFDSSVANTSNLQSSIKLGKLAAFSFTEIGLTGKSVHCDMRYFGDISNLTDHVAMQLEYTCETICHVDNINLFFHFPMPLDFEEVREKISLFGMTEDKAIGYVAKAVVVSAIKNFSV